MKKRKIYLKSFMMPIRLLLPKRLSWEWIINSRDAQLLMFTMNLFLKSRKIWNLKVTAISYFFPIFNNLIFNLILGIDSKKLEERVNAKR